jgi:hypothetical protein
LSSFSAASATRTDGRLIKEKTVRWELDDRRSGKDRDDLINVTRSCVPATFALLISGFIDHPVQEHCRNFIGVGDCRDHVTGSPQESSFYVEIVTKRRRPPSQKPRPNMKAARLRE